MDKILQAQQKKFQSFIVRDVNHATFKGDEAPALRDIVIRVNVRDANDCVRAISLICEKLGDHLTK